jgi:segregation and condensation protein B
MDDLETPPEQPETPSEQPETSSEQPAISMEELLSASEPQAAEALEDAQIKAVIEAIVYVAEEPLTLAQLALALPQPAERIRTLMDQLVAEFDKPEHGITIREVAGGYKMATKAEHHDAVRSFVKSLKPPLKLSLPALETLAVIAYKQPVTSPEIMEIRGVQGAGVLKTLLDRKLIAGAGRKNVIGKPILYKTTKEFLIQFGLKDLSELPSLKEFEEIRRMALDDGGQGPGAGGQGEEAPAQDEAASQPASEAEPPSADNDPASAAEEPVSLIPDPQSPTPGPIPSAEAENPPPDNEPVTEAGSLTPDPQSLTPGPDPSPEAEEASPDAEPVTEAASLIPDPQSLTPGTEAPVEAEPQSPDAPAATEDERP